jgi:hypothetical protein
MYSRQPATTAQGTNPLDHLIDRPTIKQEIQMLPPPPTSASTSSDAVAVNASATESAASETTAADDDGKAAENAIKQFAASEDADGNPTPVPQPHGVDCTLLVNEIYASLTAILAKVGITDVESFVEDAEAIDKTKFPGNKVGRVAYNTIRAIANVTKQYNLLNKQKGVGGAGAMKKKLEEKETRINELEKKLAELLARLG